jgi:hypothetical protein
MTSVILLVSTADTCPACAVLQKADVQLGKSVPAIKKTTAKKTNRAPIKQAPKRTAAPAREAHTQPRSVDELLHNIRSKKDAQQAMKIAKQLEAEARKVLGPMPANSRAQRAHPAQQQQYAAHTAGPRNPGRAPYAVARAPRRQEPEPQNFLLDNDRFSDSDVMDMEMEQEVKPSLAALQAQSNQFVRGVRVCAPYACDWPLVAC